MDHSSKQDTPQGKINKRLSALSGSSDQVVERPIRRVRSPSRPRAWLSRSYKPKLAGKFHKFGREDHVFHKSGFYNNQGRAPFKTKFYFNRNKRQVAAEQNRNERYKEKKSGEDRSPSQQNGVRLFQSRSTSSREKDKQRSGSKSDKSQSRERDHRGSRSKEPEPEQSAAKQAAARDRAIQKKRREIDQVYYQECEMFGLVVKMLIAKDPSLQIPIQASLQQNLRDIGARCVEAMEKFIQDYDSRELTQ
uniref:Periphilin-1 C-terminal domain-containing protein n=1 Tax=Neogobius melanostomus TaxID=47308 RepID=A0A8C6TRK5_9GOBI